MQFPDRANTESVLQSVARALGMGVFISDPAGSILWVNDVLQREFPGSFVPGSSAAEALRGATAPDRGLLPDPIAEQLARGFFGRAVPHGALRSHVLPGGEARTYRYHSFTSSPEAAGEDGEPGGFVVHCLMDVTPEKQLAETYRTSQHQLSSMKEILDILYESISNTRDVINLILVAVTSRMGFGFNRAFFLRAQGDRLRGRLGIGPASPADAHRIWSRLAESNPSLRESLRLISQTGGPPDPATAELATRIDLPLAGPEADAAEIVTAIRRGNASRIFRAQRLSAVDDQLFRLLGSNAVAVVPLQIGNELEGVLIADNFITQKPISDEDLSILKTFSGYAGIALERSRLYEELKRNVEKLQAANQELQSNQQKLLQAEKLSAIGELAAFVSHEIRNPLVAIGGLARSALSDGSEKPETVEALQIITMEVRRLERFLKETLDFVKPSVGALETVDLNLVARESISTFKEECNDHGVEVRCDLAGEPIYANIDSNLLRGALSNLIKNAIEAMSGGGRLRLDTSRNGQLARLRVADSGPGIPPEIKSRIFELFFTTKKGGTGLGLAMASQSIKSLGGTITMEDSAGDGVYRTVFAISLPLAVGEFTLRGSRGGVEGVKA
jgi:signal transduction histidine kinase